VKLEIRRKAQEEAMVDVHANGTGVSGPATTAGQRSSLMRRHFTETATTYRRLRTTDSEPLDSVIRHLPPATIVVADVGTGTGRYAERLLVRLRTGSRVVALDQSEAMLAALVRESRHGWSLVPARAAAHTLPLRARSLDALTTFNAVHHFDLEGFLREAGRVLRPGGLLFVYTRTPAQNARTVWGRYFPGFAERENRLHDEATLTGAVHGSEGLALVGTESFHFRRRSTPEHLRHLVEGHHYSTFRFYGPDELRSATATFLARLPRPIVTWTDENLLVIARRDS
jgi:SAM-dependent methyltransferase